MGSEEENITDEVHLFVSYLGGESNCRGGTSEEEGQCSKEGDQCGDLWRMEQEIRLCR